jgi:hypothetical protein
MEGKISGGLSGTIGATTIKSSGYISFAAKKIKKSEGGLSLSVKRLWYLMS